MKKFLSEFRSFIDRGSVIDMAVGIIIGGAFTAIVNALIKNIVTPLIAFCTGGTQEATGFSIALGDSGQVLDFGAFVSAVINFLLTAFVVFMLVKAFNKSRELAETAARMALNKDEEPAEEEAPTPVCPYCTQEVAATALRCPHCTSILPTAKKDDIEAMEGRCLSC